jgi:hypothetical protein
VFMHLGITYNPVHAILSVIWAIQVDWKTGWTYW